MPLLQAQCLPTIRQGNTAGAHNSQQLISGRLGPGTGYMKRTAAPERLRKGSAAVRCKMLVEKGTGAAVA